MDLKKIIFIDRDGVINVDPIGDYIKSWDTFRFEEGALKALKMIGLLGYEIIIISNQAGIGDREYPEDALWDIHKNMLREFEKEGVRIRSSHYCLHGKNAGCRCRKPETGLLEEAVKDIAFDRSQTFFIGDKTSDMEAAQRFGLKKIFVRTGHGRDHESKLGENLKPDFIVENLQEAAEVLKKCAS